jgi:hypothetical protein
MFFQSYFETGSSRAAAGLAGLPLIAVLRLYLTDFWNRIFPGENAKNRDFSGREIIKAAAVYQTRINQAAAPREPALCLRHLHPSPGDANRPRSPAFSIS